MIGYTLAIGLLIICMGLFTKIDEQYKTIKELEKMISTKDITIDIINKLNNELIKKSKKNENNISTVNKPEN